MSFSATLNAAPERHRLHSRHVSSVKYICEKVTPMSASADRVALLLTYVQRVINPRSMTAVQEKKHFFDFHLLLIGRVLKMIQIHVDLFKVVFRLRLDSQEGMFHHKLRRDAARPRHVRVGVLMYEQVQETPHHFDMVV